MEASPPCLCLSREREVTLPCLGQQQAAPAPLGRLSPPKAQGSHDTPPWVQVPLEMLPRYTWRTPALIGPSNPAPGHQLPLSPASHPCACSGPGAPGAGARSKATSRSFVTRTPPFPDRRRVASGAPGSPSRDVATSQRCTRTRPPPPPVRHSQWRRGCSRQLGTVNAAGAQVRAEPEALQSERTAPR